MYSVSLYNADVETIIHFPSADKETPHLISLDLKESLSQAEQLSFILPFNNVGYNLVNGLKTKVKVTNTKDNTIVFSGRVIPLKANMSNGKFEKEVTCEGALSYLNDTNTRRWNFKNQTPTQILTYLLTQHNSKVDISRQIQLGTIEITQPITIDTNYETSLNAIITKLRNILGGDIRVRETLDILYLDYLTSQGANNNVEIRLGYNLKDMVVEYDPMDIVTRVIPLGYGEGINQLTITKINSNLEYIQDVTAVTEYGVIEGVVTNIDIQNANTLKIYAQTVLNEKKQIKLVYTQSQLDLSVLTGHENEKYSLGDTIHTLCDVMNVDVYARVITRDRDLINSPWNPNLVISTRPITLSDQIIDIKQRNLNLENCPQGSTFITTYNSNDNLDDTHNIKIPIWLSPDIIYVNRVALHIESQKFRAYEKGLAGGGGSTATSASGGSSTATSSSDGDSTKTSDSSSKATSDITSGLDTVFENGWGSGIDFQTPPDNYFQKYVPVDADLRLDLYWLSHAHDINHTHGMAHTHSVTTPAHTHTVNIPAHTHSVTIPVHTHAIEYGIFEDTFNAGSKIKIDGVIVADAPVNGASLDIDISEYVGTPGETYNLEITSTQRGRLAIQVNVQAFIQTK